MGNIGDKEADICDKHEGYKGRRAMHPQSQVGEEVV
jgi:hypothetical protein